MEFRLEGIIPVGRPRRTWLESVEANMAELEIDKEDVHDRKKWRNNVIKRKTDYKSIIYTIYAYFYVKVLLIFIINKNQEPQR